MDARVVIIGGGHAGCEAALAAARLGVETLLVTKDRAKIAYIPCNPAIGGIAKGQLVREIDALGGMMGLAADANAMQFRMLNSSRGPAVRSPRVQIDRWSYQAWVKAYLNRQSNLSIHQDEALGIVVENGRVTGVRTLFGGVISCRAAVICAGTFIRGRIHLGETQWPGGRLDEPPVSLLSDDLIHHGLELYRLQTGTCPRINRQTVDFDKIRLEEGDAVIHPFSFISESIRCPNLPCHSTWTNEETFHLVRENLHRAPVISGAMAGKWPRYCPNFEVKVALFPDQKRQHIFVEPEGALASELYLNGLYLSLPAEIQEIVVRTVPGFEKAEIMRHGYSVEYDAVRATNLRDTLESKQVVGLFTAGQLNGTSGYEEAAAQGLFAGANAALLALGRLPFRLGREQAYIGVLVDDLTTRGSDEPYRLFTSRAEYRLFLRQDNADLRLSEIGAEIGLVGSERLSRVRTLKNEIAAGRKLLQTVRGPDGESLERRLRRPEIEWGEIASLDPTLAALSARGAEQLSIEAKYDGYLVRHLRQIRQLEKNRRLLLPFDFDYGQVNGLSREAREKLSQEKPENLDQAMRISGVSPADAALLLVRLGEKENKVT